MVGSHTYINRQRCDAVRPLCGTCQVSRCTEAICVYEVVSKDQPIIKFRHLRDIKRASSSLSSSQESEEPAEALALISGVKSESQSYSYKVNSAVSFPDVTSDPLRSCILDNPLSSLTDFGDPTAFALSRVSLDDLNMRL